MGPMTKNTSLVLNISVFSGHTTTRKWRLPIYPLERVAQFSLDEKKRPLSVDGSPKRSEKDAFSNSSGSIWT